MNKTLSMKPSVTKCSIMPILEVLIKTNNNHQQYYFVLCNTIIVIQRFLTKKHQMVTNLQPVQALKVTILRFLKMYNRYIEYFFVLFCYKDQPKNV